MQTKAELVAIAYSAPDIMEIGQEQSPEVMAALTRLIDEDIWTLEEYLAWFRKGDDAKTAAGWTVFGLTTDLDHWAGYGITTASGLAAMLDGECAKERRKEAMYNH